MVGKFTAFNIQHFLCLWMMMLSDTARFYAIFEWSPRKRGFSGTKIQPALTNFVSIAPFQGNVTGIHTLDAEVCILDLKHIASLVIAIHNLEKSIVAILFTLLEPELIPLVATFLA
jgi:hypothetical protein